MKTFLFLLLALGAALASSLAEPVPAENASITVEAHGLQPKPPLFFSATAEETVRLAPDEVTGEIKVKLHVLQGHPEVLSLGLAGDGEVTEVTGGGLRDWAVRSVGGTRFLDLRPALEAGKPDPKDLEVTIHSRLEKLEIPGEMSVLVLAPGNAAGFAAQITLEPDPSIELRVTDATGMLPFGDPSAASATPQFYSTGAGKIELALRPRGAGTAAAELTAAQLTGKVDEAGGSVDFRLQAQARAGKPGARLALLSGRAGLTGAAAGDGWHTELVRRKGETAYELVFDRAGEFLLDLGFAAAAREHEDWRTLDFRMPAGAVVPLTLVGLDAGVTFYTGDSVVPGATPQGWRGFLPADGRATLSWKKNRAAVEGALFFTASEETDIQVGSGLLRQTSRITFHVLQGSMTALRLRLDGPGEVLERRRLERPRLEVGSGRSRRDTLEVQLSRPIDHEATLTLRTQSALANLPVRAEAVRWTPEGAIRHSGYIRVSNGGAVRLEVADAQGMMQLAPEQFPGRRWRMGPAGVRLPVRVGKLLVPRGGDANPAGGERLPGDFLQLGETDRIDRPRPGARHPPGARPRMVADDPGGLLGRIRDWK